jgi:hypothetical protein
MITPEQNKTITTYLLSKNLPIDLVLEIKDHMIEQIENKENLTFEEAFEKVKESWKEELKMVYTFRLGFIHRITQFQNNIGGKINKNFFLISLYLMSIFVFITFILARINIKIFEIVMLYTYYSCIAITLLVFILNFKILKSTFFVTLPKINIYQKGSGILFSGGTQILLFNILLFDKIKYFYSTYMLFNLEFSLRNFAETLLNYLYLWMWLFGLLYFLAYKKSIKELQNRINLKL